jgi:hypothetical protein
VGTLVEATTVGSNRCHAVGLLLSAGPTHELPVGAVGSGAAAGAAGAEEEAAAAASAGGVGLAIGLDSSGSLVACTAGTRSRGALCSGSGEERGPASAVQQAPVPRAGGAGGSAAGHQQAQAARGAAQPSGFRAPSPSGRSPGRPGRLQARGEGRARG